jgi:Fur family ferric uptake transcriptional regulator
MLTGMAHSSPAVDLHQEAARRLRAIDARYTTKRRQLVEVFEQADRPLSLPDVMAGNPSLAQSSVYRNLAALELAGVVRRIATNDDFSRFELSEAVSGHHHHHLICSSCGSIEDFELPASVETAVAREFAGVAKEREFEPAAHQMDLIGRCVSCR